MKRKLPEIFDPLVPKIEAKPPAACTPKQLTTFENLVREGKEVSPKGLAERIRDASSLIFLTVDNLLCGVAALKRPSNGYRQKVGDGSGVPVPESIYPFELGWVYVMPAFRDNGFSHLLVRTAVLEGKGAPLFATSRSDNGTIHHVLLGQGFAVAGRPYPSERPGHDILVFLRDLSSAKPSTSSSA